MRSKGDRRKIAEILLAAAIVVALALLVLKAATSSHGLKGSIQDGASFLTQPISKVVSGIQKGFRGMLQFKEVTEENEKLRDQVQRLQWDKVQLELTQREAQELKELRRIFQYESIRQSQVEAANVIQVDYSSWQGVFHIDKGSEDGIKVGCSVISGDGLAGKVTQVSKKSAKVASLLSENNKVSFQVAGKQGQTGVLESDGKGGLSGYLLEQEAKVKVGDELVTSGIGMYPEGLHIGKVTDVEEKKGVERIVLKARPVVSIFSLKKVAIIL